MLSDDELREVYRRTSATPKYREWREDRATGRARFEKWLHEAQGGGSDAELRKGYLDHFANTYQTLNDIYRERVIRDPARFRKVVRELLDESVPVTTRLDRLLDGAQHIEGMGKGLATDYLMVVHPDKYCLWNGKTESGLANLGLMPAFSRGQSSGQRYGVILETVKQLREVTGSRDFPDADLFLHFVGAPEEEGRAALLGVSMPPGESSQSVPGESGVLIPPDLKTSPYILTPGLESRLEEFIESNLEKIGKEKFGRRLELFEDEEGNGRQYVIPSGRIDLLAYDKPGKTWVVFELKRGPAGDSVVGQILRYVEWVRANKAAAGELVHGVIIASDQEKGLEYSLRALPNVHLYTYSLSFDLKPADVGKPVK